MSREAKLLTPCALTMPQPWNCCGVVLRGGQLRFYLSGGVVQLGSSSSSDIDANLLGIPCYECCFSTPPGGALHAHRSRLRDWPTVWVVFVNFNDPDDDWVYAISPPHDSRAGAEAIARIRAIELEVMEQEFEAYLEEALCNNSDDEGLADRLDEQHHDDLMLRGHTVFAPLTPAGFDYFRWPY